MEKLYSKFFGGENKNLFGHSSFNNPLPIIKTNKNSENVKIQITNKNDNRITLNSSNVTEINTKITQIITKEDISKNKSSSNSTTSIARPVNFTKNDFTSFNTFAFYNSQNRKPKEEFFPPETKNSQILKENMQKEDNSNLIEIIESNILNKSPPGLNENAKEEFKLEQDKNKLNTNEEIISINCSSDDGDNDHENKENYENIIEDSASMLENSYVADSKKTSEKILKTISPLKENNKINKANNFYLTPNRNKVQIPDNYSASINSNFYKDNDKVSNDIKKIRDELILQLQDQALISKDNYQQTELNINKLRNDFTIKIDYLENKQNLQLETLRYILEHSADRKIKDEPSKVMDNSANKEENDATPPRKKKEESKKPKTERKTKKVEKEEKVEKKVKKKIPKLRSPSDSENDDLKNYIEARQSKNKQLQEDILKEDNVEIENNADRKKEKLAGIKEKIIEKQKLQSEKIAKELEKFKHKDFE